MNRTFTYHNVHPWPLPGIVNRVDIDDFDAQIEYLASLHGAEPHDVVASDPLRHKVVITVDDGFEDVYQNIFPRVRLSGIPTIVFVTTDFVDSGRPPWTVVLRFVVQCATISKIDYPFHASLGGPLQRDKIADEIKKEIRSWSPASRIDLLNRLLRDAAIDAPIPYRPVTWDQVREMERNGILIGSHTHFHSDLSAVPLNTVTEELQLSKARIEEETQRECRLLAYPNGSWSPAAMDCAQQCGYELAYTQDPGWNTQFTPKLALRRVNVPPASGRLSFPWRARLGGITSRSAVAENLRRWIGL